MIGKNATLRIAALSAVLIAFGILSSVALQAEVRTSPNGTFAEPLRGSRCTSLLRECFSYDGEERSECFHAVGTHAFCAGEKIGEIAFKRWAASPDYVGNAEGGAQPFLGPQLVDQKCLANFDNLLSAELIKDITDAERLEWLGTRLDTCLRDPGDDILVP